MVDYTARCIISLTYFSPRMAANEEVFETTHERGMSSVRPYVTLTCYTCCII